MHRTISFNLPVRIFSLEEAREAEQLAIQSKNTVYSWKASGRSHWLEQGYSISDTLGLVLMPLGLPEHIEMPDDAAEFETVGKRQDARAFVFFTSEGFTFQPESEAPEPDVENLQVLGFGVGVDDKDAFRNMLHDNAWVLESSFDDVCCMELKHLGYEGQVTHFSIKRKNS